uniref:DUF6247 family protein n=1 Tax=Amycolatopsis sp. CA-096443 TaxID=3239919 RepID=UPI003F492ADD
MTVTARDVPGLAVDDSPDRPPHRPRVTFECSAKAVRAALKQANVEALAEFERAFHVAMAEADDDFDLGRVEKVVRHWWFRAVHYLDDEASAYTAAEAERLNAADDAARGSAATG